MPKFCNVTKKIRTVLTDEEFSVYLRYVHPDSRYRDSVFERQVMACISRMFGGVRTGDLHSLTWEDFDTEKGRFRYGYAPREKTGTPQKLLIPDVLRPIIHRWWQKKGEPIEGFVFPVRRARRAADTEKGGKQDRVGERRGQMTHAGAFRRDLAAAFVEVLEGNDKARKKDVPKEGSRRWKELFEETARTKPVDFHSFRRGYTQALQDAGTNIQTAMALTGHSTVQVHLGYSQNPGKGLQMPREAVPKIQMPDDDEDTEPD